jgi:hypothetical protein
MDLMAEDGGLTKVKLLKLLLPEIVILENPDPLKLTLLNVWLLRFAVADVALKLSWDVPPTTVSDARIDSVLENSIGKEPVSVDVALPKSIVLMFSLVEIMLSAVRLYVLRANVPFVTVMVCPLLLNALPSVHTHPTPSMKIWDNITTPLVVRVFPTLLPVKVIAPV